MLLPHASLGRDGRILGHEGVGTMAEVESAVKGLKVGDRVIISYVSACGSCAYNRLEMSRRFGATDTVHNGVDD